MCFKFRVIYLVLVAFLVSDNFAQQTIDSVYATVLGSFGEEGDGPSQFQQPMAITVDPNGNIYIADTGNNRIQKFNRQGQFQTMVGGFGWNREQFQRPMDVCADNGLDVFVADYENRRIERYDKDLNWIGTFHTDPTSEEKLAMGFPVGISLSIHGDLFITDGENKRVLKLNTLREPVLSFGDFDWGAGYLLAPCKVTVLKDDRVFVTDQQIGQIVIYDYFGNFIQTIGQGLLKEPFGLGFDPTQSLIFVTDIANDQVFVIDSVGRFLGIIGSWGKKLGAFDNPTDAAVFQNILYVTESGNHRVQVFMLNFEFAP